MMLTKIGQPPTATTNPRSQYRLADPFSFYYGAPELIRYRAKSVTARLNIHAASAPAE